MLGLQKESFFPQSKYLFNINQELQGNTTPKEWDGSDFVASENFSMPINENTVNALIEIYNKTYALFDFDNENSRTITEILEDRYTNADGKSLTQINSFKDIINKNISSLAGDSTYFSKRLNPVLVNDYFHFSNESDKLLIDAIFTSNWFYQTMLNVEKEIDGKYFYNSVMKALENGSIPNNSRGISTDRKNKLQKLFQQEYEKNIQLAKNKHHQYEEQFEPIENLLDGFAKKNFNQKNEAILQLFENNVFALAIDYATDKYNDLKDKKLILTHMYEHIKKQYCTS
ncbi:MAG: hypothetical protein HRT87_11500 [Legionellales bacterium]|nr:hypothetical protein [Legionellales bacterium]